jgi:hypothetical protein
MSKLPITPILMKDFSALLAVLGGSKTPNGSLEALASLKRIEKAMKAAAITVLPKANEVFERDSQSINLESGATINGYTKPGKWKFSDHVQALEHELEVLKSDEKTSGAARCTPAEIDKNKDKLFSISAPFSVNALDMKDLIDASKTLLQSTSGITAPTA